jgi:hypothetical protein
MSECDEFSTPDRDLDAAKEIRLRLHADRCADCGEQLEVDRALRQAFRGVACPGPSLHFNQALRERIRIERRGSRRQRWRLLVMQGYWVAAAAASVVVVLQVRWPAELQAGAMAPLLAAMVGLTLIAPLILSACLRITPLDLILNTMKIFRR